MALKTVVMNSLRTWGILSVEMRQAIQLDQSAAIDINAEPVYVDNNGDQGEGEEAEGANRADSLTEKLRAEREANDSKTSEPALAKDGVAQAAPDRSRLLDAWQNLIDKQTLKIARDTLESATGHQKPEKVPDGLIEKAITALVERAKLDL